MRIKVYSGSLVRRSGELLLIFISLKGVVTPVRYEVAQFFFPFCSFSSLKNQDIYLKKLCMKLESGEIFYRGYC